MAATRTCQAVFSSSSLRTAVTLKALVFVTLLIAIMTVNAYPEVSVDMNLYMEPEVARLFEQLKRGGGPAGEDSLLPSLSALLSPSDGDSNNNRDEPRSALDVLPILPFTSGAELEFSVELQQDAKVETVNVEESIDGEANNSTTSTTTQSFSSSTLPKISAQRDLPMFAQQRFSGPYGMFAGQTGGYGGMNNYRSGYGGTGDNVNLEFQCKCVARSNLAKNMQIPTDANQAAQQQIQQLQEQNRRLQEQIQRYTAGKSSFDVFAQMLSQADGLECNCSGTSTTAGSFPMGVSQPMGGVGSPASMIRGFGGPNGMMTPYGNVGSGIYGGTPYSMVAQSAMAGPDASSYYPNPYFPLRSSNPLMSIKA